MVSKVVRFLPCLLDRDNDKWSVCASIVTEDHDQHFNRPAIEFVSGEEGLPHMSPAQVSQQISSIVSVTVLLSAQSNSLHLSLSMPRRACQDLSDFIRDRTHQSRGSRITWALFLRT